MCNGSAADAFSRSVAGSKTDEELELIDLRYQQSVALMDLEDLFADGCFDCL